jgi:BirA family biotin operon repressor/biotin-[acetyl-CoA-carboxylase] ligase
MPLSPFHVLRLLADGEFHSGVDVARALGVSRASVCNSVRVLEDAGLTIYSVRGRGYRLAQTIELIDRELLRQELGAQASRFTIDVMEQATSTNTLLMERAARGAPSGSVVVAEWQSQGRGRHGRAWHAAPGSALTLSLLWRFARPAAALAGLSLAVGVAVTRLLKSLGASDAGLKWPNDVMWQGAKLAGILIELQGDMLGPSAAVIGIGINGRLAAETRARIDQPAADLETICGGELSRNRLLARLLVELAGMLDDFERAGFAPFRKEWERSHVYQGEGVRLMRPDGTQVSGRAAGVADDGSLLLDTGQGVVRCHSGELSGSDVSRLRPA